MGVDTQVMLPPAARLQDVATVLGALLGCPTHLHPLGAGYGVSCRAEGVEVRSYDNTVVLVECARIIVKAPDTRREFMYHFEFNEHGEHGIILSSRAENLALGMALVNFFGGAIDFDDSDETEVDVRLPARADIHASGGEQWNAFQRRMAAVKPLTEKQIATYAEVAAYPD